MASALALGVAIPSSPGYIGTYQWIGVAALGLLDVPPSQALAFAILMHASWYVPTHPRRRRDHRLAGAADAPSARREVEGDARSQRKRRKRADGSIGSLRKEREREQPVEAPRRPDKCEWAQKKRERETPPRGRRAHRRGPPP